MGTGVHSQGRTAQNNEVGHLTLIALRLKMSGAIILLYSLMARAGEKT
jgi:hypothetical protein